MIFCAILLNSGIHFAINLCIFGKNHIPIPKDLHFENTIILFSMGLSNLDKLYDITHSIYNTNIMRRLIVLATIIHRCLDYIRF